MAGTLAPLATSTVVGPRWLLSVSPAAIPDASWPVRALLAFGVVLATGGLLLWRLGPIVDRSRATAMDRPLSSLVYGLAAHAVIAFGGIYLTVRLSQFQVSGWNVGALGVLAGLLLVLLAAGLGFTVVGSTLVELRWGRRRWLAPVAGALVAGVAGGLGSLPGGLLWFVVVSIGIGGLARSWLHADVVDGV